MYIFKQSYLISLYFAISALIVNSLPGTFKPRQDSDIVPRQLHDFDFDFDIRNTDTSRDSDLFAFTIDGINNNDRAGSSTDPAEIDDHTLSEYVSAGVIDFPEQSTVDVVATCPDDLAKSVRPKRKPGEPKPNRNKPSDGTTTPPACPNNRISACCTGGKAITPSGKGQAGCQTCKPPPAKTFQCTLYMG